MHLARLLIFKLILVAITGSSPLTTENFVTNTTEMIEEELATDETPYGETTAAADQEGDENEEGFRHEDDARILNKDFDRLGKIYVSQYYSLFDDPKTRLALVALYHKEDSFLTFDGERYRGTQSILRKFERLSKLRALRRHILAIDTQPLLDGGIVVNVIGRVRITSATDEAEADDKPGHLYAQTFVYKPESGTFFLRHDIFRVIRP